VILRQSDVDERGTRAPAFANYRQRFDYHREDLQHYSYRTVGRKLRLQLPKWPHSGRMPGARDTPGKLRGHSTSGFVARHLAGWTLDDNPARRQGDGNSCRERTKTQFVLNHHWIMLQLAGTIHHKNSHTPSCKRKTWLRLLLPPAKQTGCRVVLHIGNVNARV